MFKCVFYNQGQVYELYARSVGQGALYGFVEIGDIVFGSGDRIVIDPSEERLRSEFEGVRRFYIPVHAIVRIDEVEHEGPAKIREARAGEAKVTPFPGMAGPERDSKT